MIAAILAAAASICVAIPSHTEPVYFQKGAHLQPPVWMTACNVTPSGWSSMTTAPRDGTVIEIRDALGLLPTFGIYRWADRDHGWADATPQPPCTGPPPIPIKDKNGMVVGESTVSSCATGLFEASSEPGLAWRPLTGSPDAYKTHNPSPAEWRRAAMKGMTR